MAQRLQVRGDDSACPTPLQVVHRIFVAGKAVEKVEIDNGQLASRKNLLDQRLAVLRVAGQQVDDLPVRSNCLL